MNIGKNILKISVIRLKPFSDTEGFLNKQNKKDSFLKLNLILNEINE